MFTSEPHLRIQRPSPTTISFTVSTDALHSTSSPSRYAVRWLTIGVRIVAIMVSLLVLLARLACNCALPNPDPLDTQLQFIGEPSHVQLAIQSPYMQSQSQIPQSQSPVRNDAFVSPAKAFGSGPALPACRSSISAMERFVPYPLSKALAPVHPLVLGLSALVTCLVCVRRFHTEESLLVLRSLGVQTSSSARSYLGRRTTRFIPTAQVQDIFIHEAFRGFEVRFYLIIVVKGGEEVAVVFPKLLPRLAILEQVWRGARGCLFDSEGSDATSHSTEKTPTPKERGESSPSKS